MTSLKQTNSIIKQPLLKWPQQLHKPTELINSLGTGPKLRPLKSPICSKIILQFVGSWSYLLANILNKTNVINAHVFNEQIDQLEESIQSTAGSADDEGKQNNAIIKKSPLLTYSNHISCIDDPVLWAALLPFNYYSTNTDALRWSAAAVEICFSKAWHSAFFSLGKTFPIVRGAGIDQVAMDYASALLNYNQWLHLFPEGRVMRDNRQQVISNKERGYIFKWGISKLILDYFRSPSGTKNKIIRILPFYHLGLDKILPIGWPYIPRFGKQITIYIKPKVIEMDSHLLGHILANQSLNLDGNKSRSNDEICRIKLTNYFEAEMEKLIEPATKVHQSNLNTP